MLADYDLSRGGLLSIGQALDIADTVMNDLEQFFKGHGVDNRVTRAMLDRMT